MKKFTMSVVAVLALSTFTIAGGDIAPVEPVVETPVVSQNWDGFYVGGSIGGSNLKSTWTDVDNDWVGENTVVDTFKEKSTSLGLNMGYNWQSNNVVYGIVGGVSYQDVSNTTYILDDVYVDNSLTFIADLRAKAGYSFGNLLPYVTAGVAYSDLEHSWLEIDDTEDSWSDFSNKTGYVYGVGIEYAISSTVSVGAQWSHYDFGSVTKANPTDYRMKVESELDNYSLIVNYRF